MQKRVSVVAVAAWAITLPLAAHAASWSPVGPITGTVAGDLGVSTTAAALTDGLAPQFSSVITDTAGNIFAALQLSNGVGGTAQGSVVILTPNTPPAPGYTRQVVDLQAAGAAGPVTKLVLAGDGKVYGLQNWGQIRGSGTDGLNSRIIRINANGTVNVIHDNSTVRLYGMAVGGDGNVYFTRNGVDNKTSYFWKYDVVANTLTDLFPGRNDGYNENQRLFNLEYVGREVARDYFAIIGSQGSQNLDSRDYGHAKWYPDVIWPDNGRMWNGRTYGSQPGYRDWVTATAYDAARKKLWVAGRGTSLQNLGWRFASGGGSVEDLGGGNYGIGSTKTAGKFPYWRRALDGTAGTPAMGNATLVTRFKVQSISQDYSSYLMRVAGRSAVAQAFSPKAGITVRYESGEHRLKLWNINANVQIADLGSLSVGTDTFYEIGLHVDPATSRVFCWRDGSAVAGSPFTISPNSTADTGEVVFGSACSVTVAEQPVGDTSTCFAVFDWAGFGPGLIAPPYSQSSFRAGPLGPTSMSPSGTDGILAAYLDGSTLPELFVSGNNMTRWAGDVNNSALFTGPPIVGDLDQPGIVLPVAQWQVNGNAVLPDGGNFTNGSNQPDNSRYWVTTMAVNPCDGSAWMAIAGNQSTLGHYTPQPGIPYTHEGRVFSVSKDGVGPDGDEGVPLTLHTSQVVALHFVGAGGRTILAIAADKSSGAYTLYSASNPSPSCCNEVPFDSDGDNDVDMDDFGAFQACFSGPNPYTDARCACFDRYPSVLAPDSKVNDNDFVKFMNCDTRSSVTQTNLLCDQ